MKIKHGKDYKQEKNINATYPVLGTGGVITYIDSFLCDWNCVCIGRKGTINKPIYMDEPFWSVDTLFYSIPNVRENPKFQYYLFQTINWLKYNAASGVPSLSSSTIESIPISRPFELEQKKISTFLTVLDNKIKKQEELIEAIKSYKRGALRKVFDFTEEPFRSATLGELCHITTGKLDANAMVEKGKYRFYTCAKEHYYINTYAFNTEALLISGNGANVGYIHHYNGKFNAYQRTYVLTDFVGVNPTFLEYYLETYLSERIESEKKAGNTPYIVLSTLSEMKIICPNIKNQNTISKLFKHLDLKIKKEEDVLYCLQDLKNGLLQKMFI